MLQKLLAWALEWRPPARPKQNKDRYDVTDFLEVLTIEQLHLFSGRAGGPPSLALRRGKPPLQLTDGAIKWAPSTVRANCASLPMYELALGTNSLL